MSKNKNGAEIKRRRKRKVYETFSGRCFWCAECLEYEGSGATMDHVVTRFDGGTNAFENMVLSCNRCNNQRGHMRAVKFLMRKCSYLSPAVAHEIMRTHDNRIMFHRSRSKASLSLA